MRWLCWVPVALLVAVAGCGDGDAGAAGKPTVVATTTQVADFARNVAGSRFKVVQILAPNADPHEYELRPHDLRFAPDISTASRATIGGMIANNSSGARSVLYGKTIDHVIEQHVVLSDGSVAHFRPIDAAALDAVCAGATYILAGSIRDDGPLPDVVSDTLEAQRLTRENRQYRKELRERYGVVDCNYG